MDTKDEELLKLQENPNYLPEGHFLDLRLYETHEAREAEAVVTGKLRAPSAKMKAYILASMELRETPQDKYFLSGIIRFKRFCDTVRGFYSGSLDLTGRHQKRYESHLRRFMSFVAEFCLVMRRATRNVDRRGYYISSPPSLLEQFRSRWRLSPYISEDNCAIQISEALHVMAKTTPKMQQLSLIDLPSEMLCYIFDLLDVYTARKVGMTCRTLREASSPCALKVDQELLSGYGNLLNSLLIQSRTFALRLSHSIQRASPILPPDCLAGLLREARVDLIIEQIDFTLANPQILRRIQVLYLRNEWPVDCMERAGVTASALEDYLYFWGPIVRNLTDLLGHVNASHLDLHQVGLEDGMLERLSEMPNIRNLTLFDCPFLATPHSDTSLRMVSVVNAEFCSCSDSRYVAFESYLELVPLLPRLRCLVLDACPKNPFYIPLHRADFIQQCNPFGTLERLCIKRISDTDVPGLCTWIRTGGASARGLHLTHFKLVSRPGLQEAELMDLIDALAPAPLRVLVLSGIACAELSLFDRLADAFPGLKALTLAVHGDRPLFEGEVCAWPYATWEYAPRFARFRALKHFAWNLHTGPVPAPSPWDMPLMEAGYPESEVKRPEEWELEMEGHMFSEWNCIARMFSVHCGTLESLVFSTRGPFTALEWCIKYGKDGTVEVTPRFELLSESYLAYDPYRSMRSWFFDDFE